MEGNQFLFIRMGWSKSYAFDSEPIEKDWTCCYAMKWNWISGRTSIDNTSVNDGLSGFLCNRNTKMFSIEKCETSFRLLSQNLIKGIKHMPVFLKRFEFEKRDESKLSAQFGNVGPLGFQNKEQNFLFLL